MRATMKMPAVTMVGQPHVQGKLRALAHRANEKADADDRDELPGCTREAHLCELTRLGERFGVAQRARVGHDQADTQDEAEVADAVYQERFHVCEDSARLVEPEPDEQVGNQAHSLPAEKQLQEVVAHDQHQHRESEQ
jgi:hypothetical protein